MVAFSACGFIHPRAVAELFKAVLPYKRKIIAENISFNKLVRIIGTAGNAAMKTDVDPVIRK
jgi:hypothetical protein